MKNRSPGNTDRESILALGPLTDIRALIERASAIHGSKPVLSESARGRVVSYSCEDVYNDTAALGTALIELGYEGAHIALIGENSYSWIISYLAVICGVGVIVPLDKELTAEDIGILIDRSDASLAICSRSYLKDIEARLPGLKKLKNIAVADTTEPGNGYLSLPKLMERGRALLASGDDRFFKKELDREACASILFTSGTTGANKGVMLSHKNICANVYGIVQVTPIEPPSFSMLPFNHAFEFNCEILTGIYLGAHIYICSSLKRALQDLKSTKPNMTLVVPMLLDSIYNAVWRESERRGKTESLKRGVRLSNRLMKLGIDLRPLLFKEIKNSLGGNLNLVICGGAPADPRVLRGLRDVGIDIYNGYGITECSPIVTLNLDAGRNPGSVGKPLPGVSVKIDGADADGSGEILVRGDNVMLGYYNDEAATEASFTDGWFRTGDYGMLDENGELILTGRIKNLIILDNGKNVHPEELEEKLQRAIPYVAEVVVYAAEKKIKEKKQHVITAALHIDLETSFPGLPEAEIERRVAEDIKRVNRTLPVYKQIQGVIITQEDFTKTTTLKIVRQRVIERHDRASRIELK